MFCKCECEGDSVNLVYSRESSSRTKEFFNLPILILKARCPGGSQFFEWVHVHVGMPKQALGGLP